MNRNTFQSYNASQFSNSYKTAGGPFREQGSRSPLYPIGPTLTQPEFKPVQRGVSPYISRQGMVPPSYEQRYLHQTSSAFANNSHLSLARPLAPPRGTYDDRERELIARNEAEIDEQHKRREQIRVSYEREINSKSAAMARNNEKKQRLLAEVEALQHSYDEWHERLMGLRPPSQKLNTYEPIDRKQQEMIIMKNKLISQMREKEEELHREEEEEEKYWEQEILQKERIFLKLETELNAKRVELNLQKTAIERPDFASLEDEIRQNRYNDFAFAAGEIEAKIARLTDERERLNSEIRDTLTLKKPQLHNMRLKHEDLVREREEIQLRTTDLERIGKEMEEANSNLLRELERKEQMITTYELDIHSLRDKKVSQEHAMAQFFAEAREDIENELIPGLAKEIADVQEELRFEQSATTKLKTQYQRMYELLCSAATTNLHQTFNSIYNVRA